MIPASQNFTWCGIAAHCSSALGRNDPRFSLAQVGMENIGQIMEGDSCCLYMFLIEMAT